MSYLISDKTQTALDGLTGSERVRAALAFQEADQEAILAMQMELALIPAPTFREGEKAARFLALLEAEGLEDCRMDPQGNVTALRRGTGGGKTTLLEGHLDTVFPLDTKLEIHREGGWVHCPGITDDTRGLCVVLSVVRALNAAGIATRGDLLLAGTVQEEGVGGLNGMKYLLDHHPEIGASISVDGPGHLGAIYRATAIKTAEITFQGQGGHAYIAFGERANPAHAACRAAAKIADIQVPRDPKTTFAVTGLTAGSMSAVHAIPDRASFVVNYRANTRRDLEELEEQIFRAVREGCQEETARWGKDEITYTVRWIVDVGTGEQGDHAPIVEAAAGAALYLGAEEPVLPPDGCTNCNRALEAGLPAVCLGESDYDPRIHSLQERFREQDAHKGAQQALLVALLCAGTQETEPIL